MFDWLFGSSRNKEREEWENTRKQLNAQGIFIERFVINGKQAWTLANRTASAKEIIIPNVKSKQVKVSVGGKTKIMGNKRIEMKSVFDGKVTLLVGSDALVVEEV